MRIKKAGLADIRELRDIGNRTYLQHYLHLWNEGGMDWYLNRCFAPEVLQTDLADPNIEYYLIEDENQYVGILKLILRKPLPDSNIENALYLEKIYFIKEWTGRGAGQKLIQFVFNRAQELNRDCVWLMAMDTSDKAIAAYQRAGFTEHSLTRLDFELMKEEFRGMIILKHCFKINDN
jgi:diamine N-acetyltransferase